MRSADSLQPSRHGLSIQAIDSTQLTRVYLNEPPRPRSRRRFYESVARTLGRTGTPDPMWLPEAYHVRTATHRFQHLCCPNTCKYAPRSPSATTADYGGRSRRRHELFLGRTPGRMRITVTSKSDRGRDNGHLRAGKWAHGSSAPARNCSPKDAVPASVLLSEEMRVGKK